MNADEWVMKTRYRRTFFVVFIFLFTLAMYWPVSHYGFLRFDDHDFVTENPHVNSGISIGNISWAFRLPELGDTTYYHPVTWLSHMLDCQLWGLNPSAHHLTSLLFHLLNSLLILFFLAKATGRFSLSAAVSLLFAIHPLNIESVAWIAERKNVLSTFFWLTALLAYLFYVEKPRIWRYALLLILLILGLLSKPMVVTLPFTLLLLDLWPLNRFDLSDIGGSAIDEENFAGRATASAVEQGKSVRQPNRSMPKLLYSFLYLNRKLFIEKIPLFIITALWTTISSLLASRLMITVTTQLVSPELRIANAAISTVQYCGKVLWPFNLAAFYPYPKEMFPVWMIIGAVGCILFLTIITFSQIKKKPFLAAGWLWFLGTLFPALGFKQLGLWPALADRWAYVPMIGLMWAAVWLLQSKADKYGTRSAQAFLTAAFVLLALILSVNTRLQIRHWSSQMDLFKHTLEVTEENHIPHYAIANELITQKKYSEAIPHLTRAIELEPMFPPAYVSLARIMIEQEQYHDAVRNLQTALSIDARARDAHFYAGLSFLALDKYGEALKHFLADRQSRPERPLLNNSIGIAYLKTGDLSNARKYFLDELALDSSNSETHSNLAYVLKKQNDLSGAIEHYTQALSINPKLPEAHINLANIFYQKKEFDRAIQHYMAALDADPSFIEAHIGVGHIYYQTGDLVRAEKSFHRAIEINPRIKLAYIGLGRCYVRQKKIDAAIRSFRTASELEPQDLNTKRQLERLLHFKTKTEEKIRNIEKQLKSQPGDATTYSVLAELYKQVGKLDESFENYWRAGARDDRTIAGVNDLVAVYAARGEYDQAIAVLNEMARVASDNSGIYYNMACLHAKNDNPMESIRWLKRALDKGYRNWDLIQKDKDLDAIREHEGYLELLRQYRP